MKILNCIAVDDEPHATTLMENYIKKTPFLNLLGTFNNPIEALQLVQSDKVDLVFLDIQMAELTGIEFLNIAGNKTKFIICTAYHSYALEGYEHNVVDYLLKPFPYDRFYKACQKALPIENTTPALQMQNTNAESNPENEYIFVKCDLKIQKLYLKEILFVEGLKDYVSIYTKKDRIITLQTMKKMEDTLLKPHFARVHRSYLIAIDKIDSIERNRVFIGDKVISIGDTYKESFFELINLKNI